MVEKHIDATPAVTVESDEVAQAIRDLRSWPDDGQPMFERIAKLLAHLDIGLTKAKEDRDRWLETAKKNSDCIGQFSAKLQASEGERDNLRVTATNTTEVLLSRLDAAQQERDIAVVHELELRQIVRVDYEAAKSRTLTAEAALATALASANDHANMAEMFEEQTKDLHAYGKQMDAQNVELRSQLSTALASGEKVRAMVDEFLHAAWVDGDTQHHLIKAVKALGDKFHGR